MEELLTGSEKNIDILINKHIPKSVNSNELDSIINTIINENPKALADYV